MPAPAVRNIKAAVLLKGPERCRERASCTVLAAGAGVVWKARRGKRRVDAEGRAVVLCWRERKYGHREERGRRGGERVKARKLDRIGWCAAREKRGSTFGREEDIVGDIAG